MSAPCLPPRKAVVSLRPAPASLTFILQPPFQSPSLAARCLQATQARPPRSPRSLVWAQLRSPERCGQGPMPPAEGTVSAGGHHQPCSLAPFPGLPWWPLCHLPMGRGYRFPVSYLHAGFSQIWEPFLRVTAHLLHSFILCGCGFFLNVRFWTHLTQFPVSPQ